MIKPEATSETSRRYWLPLFVLGVGILLTLAVTYFVSQNLALKSRQEFREKALQADAHIQNRIEAYIALLRGGGALFATDSQVGQTQFHAFVKRLRMDDFYKGVQGLGFAARVADENRAEVWKQVRVDHPTFRIWPEQGQAEAFPIILLEPMDERNRAAIGYDMFTEPIRRAAMIRARDTALPAATGKVSLVQEISGPKQPGFLIYLPVYSTGYLPETVEERRRALQGFIYSPFRVHDFLRGVAELQKDSGIHFEVYDGLATSPENLLLDSRLVSGQPRDVRSRFESLSTIEIAGEPWTIRYQGSSELRLRAWLVPLLLVAGLTLTATLSYSTFAEARARRRAEQSELQLQTIADALPVLIGAVDRELRYRFNNRTYETWLGKAKQELSGKSMKEVLGPETFHKLEPHLREAVSGREVEFETDISYGGRVRHVHGVIIPEYDNHKDVVGLFLLLMDISERKRQEIRTDFLVRASKALSDSMDYKVALRNVVRLAVPGIADWCALDLLDEKGQLQRFEVAHVDPTKDFALDPSKPLPESRALREVVKDGAVLFEPEVTDQFLQEAARSSEHFNTLRALKLQSVIGVPIRGRRGIYGVLIFATADSRRIYTQDDLHAAEELASHVGLAVENALFLQEVQQEINERRIVQQAFRESEERFRIMVEQARDYAIFMLDPNGLISSWNSGAERILGYTESEVLGQSASIIFTPEDRQNGADRDELQAAKEKGRALDERWHVRKDGARFFCSGYVFALRDEDGALRGYTMIMRDITERKRWEEDIKRLNQELESRVEQRTAALRESYEQMETFTYTVAHDLRAPLRSMLGFSQAILEENETTLDETSRDFLRRIMRASGRMDALIQDLLAYSHVARTDLQFEPVDLQDVINDVLNALAEQVHEKDATIISQGPFPRVYAHRATLHTILLNLISNAIKFSSATKSPRVELRAEARSYENLRMVRCWVIDNGIGISDEHLERIFRVFERLHGPERYTGTGIGLAIVKKGVERMNGRVGVESKRNEGSRFWIELPAAD